MDRRNLLTTLAIATAAEAVGMPGAHAQGPSPGQVLIERFAQTLSGHDIDGFAALFADGYVNHQTSAAAPPPPAGISPKQGTVRFFGGRLKGMPDLKVTIETSVANGDTAAASFVYEGTHTGEYLGVAPTGRRVRFTSCDIFRVADGKIVEHWGMGDIAGIMAQLKS
jgi:predicted SnoaL-like aldol condensation-catalyzing enzyme